MIQAVHPTSWQRKPLRQYPIPINREILRPEANESRLYQPFQIERGYCNLARKRI